MEYVNNNTNHTKTAYRALTVSGISFVSAALGIFIIPFILSPIAMIFSHLSKGRLKTRHFAAQAATVIAILSFILNGVMIGISVYKFNTDPEVRGKINSMMESVYGISLDEYTESIMDEFQVTLPDLKSE